MDVSDEFKDVVVTWDEDWFVDVVELDIVEVMWDDELFWGGELRFFLFKLEFEDPGEGEPSGGDALNRSSVRIAVVLDFGGVISLDGIFSLSLSGRTSSVMYSSKNPNN